VQALEESLRAAIQAQARFGINQSAPTTNLLDREAQRGDIADQSRCSQLYSDWVGWHENESRTEC